MDDNLHAQRKIKTYLQEQSLNPKSRYIAAGERFCKTAQTTGSPRAGATSGEQSPRITCYQTKQSPGEFGWPNSPDNYRDNGTFANETPLTPRSYPAGYGSYFRTLFRGIGRESPPIMITWPRKGGVGFTG
jgi:hypothetical protein